MSKTDNLHDYLADLADAIREKKGTTEPINAQSFAEEIRTIESGNGWTGHADVEGLKAIGWDDEDIAYYQKYGVNWNEEDDEYHKVSDDNKALYGVLTADNIQDYKDRIVYLPKIDTSGLTSMRQLFYNCSSMIAIPLLDTSNVINMNSAFQGCNALICLPKLNTSQVTDITGMCYNCYSLTYIPNLDFSKVKGLSSTFYQCYNIKNIPLINSEFLNNMTSTFYACMSISAIPPLNTSNVSSFSQFCLGCRSLVKLPMIDMISGSGITINYCHSLQHCYFKNIRGNLSFPQSPLLSKESILYIINNEAATSEITITLSAYAYSRLAEDADVVAALANHPLISLASA